jgi:SnoaL-like domain
MPSTRFRQAVEARDVDAMVAALAEDVVFRSPVVFKPYEGRAAVGMILAAVFETFEDFRYVDELHGEDIHALVFSARVGDRALDGIDLLRFDDAGLIREFTVMIRPLSGLTALAEAMRARLEAASA